MVGLKGSYEILAEIPDLKGMKIIRLGAMEIPRVGFYLPDSSATAVFWLIDEIRKLVKQIVELDPFDLEVKPEHRIRLEAQDLKIIDEIEIVDCDREYLLVFPVDFLTLCDFAKKKIDRCAEIVEVSEMGGEALAKKDDQENNCLLAQDGYMEQTKITAKSSKWLKRREWREQVHVAGSASRKISCMQTNSSNCLPNARAIWKSSWFWQSVAGAVMFVMVFSAVLGFT